MFGFYFKAMCVSWLKCNVIICNPNINYDSHFKISTKIRASRRYEHFRYASFCSYILNPRFSPLSEIYSIMAKFWQALAQPRDKMYKDQREAWNLAQS